MLSTTGVGLKGIERRTRPGLKRCLRLLSLYRTGYRIDELV